MRVSEEADKRDLSGHQDWWKLEAPIRISRLQEYWRAELVPTEIKLREDSDSVYVTQSGKRVLVTAAREFEHGVQPKSNEYLFFAESSNYNYEFETKSKSYEVFVLLCWEQSEHRLHDFVIPQDRYIAAWTAYKKAHKADKYVPFWCNERTTTMCFASSLIKRFRWMASKQNMLHCNNSL